MATTPPTPVGIKLGKGYSVGAKLGEGAQAAIHALLYKGKPTNYVVKCAPVAPPRRNPKAKRSLLQINADSIYCENLVVSNHLQPLQKEMMIPEYGCRDLYGLLECDGTVSVSVAH